MVTSNKNALKYIEEREKRDPAFAAGVRQEFNKLEFARALRQLRETRGTSQADLAAAVGTTQSAIARIESGRTIPKMDVVARIVQALGGSWQSKFKAASGVTLSVDMGASTAST